MTYLFTSVICIGQNQINNAIGTNPILTNPAFAGTFSRNLLHLNYNKIKVLLGIGQYSTIGFGLIFKKFDIHYQLNYIGNDLNNISEINNYYSEFNIQMAFPKQINRKTTSFDFGLF